MNTPMMSVNLTPRQLDVVASIARSEKLSTIARRWGRSEKTAEFHRVQAQRKLGISPGDTAALTRYAIRERLVRA